MRAVWKFHMKHYEQEIEAPGLELPFLVAVQDHKVHVWAEIDDARPLRRLMVGVRGTGHPIRRDERYIGTHFDDLYVWHYYASDPMPGPPLPGAMERQTAAPAAQTPRGTQ